MRKFIFTSKIYKKISSILSESLDIFPILGKEENLLPVTAAVSKGIAQEVGTSNDEFLRFLYDASSKKKISADSLFSEMITLDQSPHLGVGVRIWSSESDRLDIYAKGMRELLHPHYSFNDDGTIKQLVLFPAAIAKILARQEIEAVIVKQWAQNTILGNWDPKTTFYQTNIWELKNNDAIRFSQMISQKQLALLGTHDVIAHIAHSNKEEMQKLSVLAKNIYRELSHYFDGIIEPNLGSRILPYAATVILDDLAQPPSYQSKSHQMVLGALMDEIRRRSISPKQKNMIIQFPKKFKE
ncbi:MAG: hypothetical protein CL678_09430, partial [Bdellovibrionaceae bacterium]|nr:hypothetical protein [Pseudobdellovibrionaceae bacterium]